MTSAKARKGANPDAIISDDKLVSIIETHAKNLQTHLQKSGEDSIAALRRYHDIGALLIAQNSLGKFRKPNAPMKEFCDSSLKGIIGSKPYGMARLCMTFARPNKLNSASLFEILMDHCDKMAQAGTPTGPMGLNAAMSLARKVVKGDAIQKPKLAKKSKPEVDDLRTRLNSAIACAEKAIARAEKAEAEINAHDEGIHKQADDLSARLNSALARAEKAEAEITARDEGIHKQIDDLSARLNSALARAEKAEAEIITARDEGIHKQAADLGRLERTPPPVADTMAGTSDVIALPAPARASAPRIAKVATSTLLKREARKTKADAKHALALVRIALDYDFANADHSENPRLAQKLGTITGQQILDKYVQASQWDSTYLAKVVEAVNALLTGGIEQEMAKRKKKALAAMTAALNGADFLARDVLGVNGYPRKDEVPVLFRRAVLAFGYHPDHGGTSEMMHLALKARDQLMHMARGSVRKAA